MNKNNLYTGILFSLVMLAGCSKYLEQVPNDILTEEEVFTTRASAEKFLANIYYAIPREWSQRFAGGGNAGVWTGAADEGEYLWGFVNSNPMNIGSWDAGSGFSKDYWRNYYRAIRSATIFIANVDKVSIDMTDEQKRRYKAEARALRAIFYFYLTRIYGPVVLLGEDVIPVDAPIEQINIPRSSMDECVAFIVSELQSASADLPARPINDANIARLTKGIALAYVGRTYLQAASPLYNGNADYANLKNSDGKQLISQTYDENKWKLAADAYKAFITEFVPSTYSLYRKNDGNGNYSAFLSCRDVMLDNWNPEVIFGRTDDENARNYETTPFHDGYASEVRGSGGLGATQRQVDAYFMANGKPISDPTSGFVRTGTSQFQAPDDDQQREVLNQWTNREPRFYVNITYDNRKWLNTNTGEVVTRFYYRGNSGKGISNDYSPTGYVVRKGARLNDWHNGIGVIVEYRLANLFLDYIEALNEYDPNNSDILLYLNMIRERAGIPGYGQGGLDVPSGKEAMRQAIRHERQVELSYENVRYFDTRRWKIAETTDNGPAIGMDIDSPLPGFYNEKAFETRVFNKRHYFFPIPEEDVNNNPEMVQNTGW
ncbi:RagB/SusD family nutrient uptake outer membrane protein [Foetidibacter luteolus]|uniref:RagB/SusD family nutrient uptake outer membrane protein n=1 Tax=Foetidibacter luteolus TaxID=2608880 RepID=UPI00129A480A|nr:RagB/SusD family nutrient uptake outer membrane protein [Foetidibacter luteolus]